jgi:hypothetical protein
MSQIMITAKGSYPFGHTLPEALVAGLVAEIETHMRAYGIAGVDVVVMQGDREKA